MERSSHLDYQGCIPISTTRGSLHQTIPVMQQGSIDVAVSQTFASVCMTLAGFKGKADPSSLQGQAHNPMTNFSVSCLGYVMESASSSSSEGFRFRIIPTSFSSGETATASDLSRYVFNLLLKHMG